MKKCNHPQHPFCTQWVMAGADACAGGHAQPGAAPTSFEMISAARSARPGAAPLPASVPRPSVQLPPERPVPGERPHLRVSGFDPRAAGGRQSLKLELRGMPQDCPPLLAMQLDSALLSGGSARQVFTRSARGSWRPVLIEFSSRGMEHGQYHIDVELSAQRDGRLHSKWACTLVILAPRPDATLSDIHQSFLSTHKNVRIMADDASLARVDALSGARRIDIDVHARNGAIAKLHLDARAGQADVAVSTMAWDEDLIEIDVPAQAEAHPHQSAMACLVNAAPEAGAQRQVRLFAMSECVLGRFELLDPEADVLLAHFSEDGQDREGLTRRLSGRHAVIRRGPAGYEIEDVSRFGILIDGAWPGKGKPVALRLGMRIELSASIKGIVVLGVSAVLPHGVILHRIDQGAQAESFYLLEPGKHPGFPLALLAALPVAAGMPLLYHQHGGFWHLDLHTGRETALTPAAHIDSLSQMAPHTRFASEAYPECWIVRSAHQVAVADERFIA